MPRHKRPENDPLYQPEVDPLDEQVEEEDDVASQLAKLGAELSQVATNKAKRTAKLREVEAFLGRLKIEDFPELAESPIIQNFAKMLAPVNLRAGEVRNAGTLAEVRKEWNIEDCWREGSVTFVPFETLPLIFNGVRVDVVARKETTIPRPHYEIYLNHLKAVDNGEQFKRWLGGDPVAPDRNWMTPEAYRIRALGLVRMGVGPISLENPVEDTGGENG